MYRRITITLQESEFEALRAMAKAHTRPAKHQIVHLIRQAALQEGFLAEGDTHAPRQGQDDRSTVTVTEPAAR